MFQFKHKLQIHPWQGVVEGLGHPRRQGSLGSAPKGIPKNCLCSHCIVARGRASGELQWGLFGLLDALLHGDLWTFVKNAQAQRGVSVQVPSYTKRNVAAGCSR